MSFKEKFDKYFQESYMQKYGDRISSTAGTVVSSKHTKKNYIIFQ